MFNASFTNGASHETLFKVISNGLNINIIVYQGIHSYITISEKTVVLIILEKNIIQQIKKLY